MKKVSSIALAICSTFLAASFSACGDLNFGQIAGEVLVKDWKIDLSEFDPVVSYNGEIDYGDIKLVGTLVSEDKHIPEYTVQCTPDMVVEGGKTDSVGNHELVISHDKKTFTVEYTVKYRVDFEAMGDVFATQHVLESSEIELPTPPEYNGYTFAYWATAIPDTLTDNLTIQAEYYSEVKKPPQLRGVERVYEPTATLADLTLPSNSNGEWVFTDELTTPIGGVGTHEFSVRFMPAVSELAPQEGVLTVTVTPKTATIEIVTDSFVYDGEAHAPTYTVTDNALVELVGEKKTEAGTHQFMYVVTDPNYTGLYMGEFTIAKPSVTITVDSYAMKYGETVPEIEYTVEGFANTDLLDITVEQPRVFSIGTYDLTVKVNNPNVNATIVNGALTVDKGDLAGVSAPSNSTMKTPAIYEHRIDTVELTGDFRGDWTWKDPSAIINAIDTFTATAVFTPTDRNYNVIEYEVVITNISKRTLAITIVTDTYTYTGEEFTIVYALEEGKDLTVDGVVSATDAGEYATTLTINDTYYQGTTSAKLVVRKATPPTDFTTEYKVTWNDFLGLDDIALPDGYTWDAPETSLVDRVGTFEYPATYTPKDTKNYEIIHGAFSVKVEKAKGVLSGVEDSYTFVYEKDTVHKLLGITSTPGTIEYVYVLNGETVDQIKTAGTYTVTVNLIENDYYTADSVTTTVVVEQATNTEYVDPEQEAVYKDSISKLTLPEGIFGTWSWKDKAADALVGDAGEHVFVAVFTPDDPVNYAAREVKVTVTIDKFTVSEPTVQTSFVYTGGEITVFTLPENAPYTATGTSAENVGAYTLVLTLTDPANFKWSGSSEASVSFPYAITQAPNAITSLSISGWTYDAYDAEANKPVAAANFGIATVEYFYALVGDDNYTKTVPTDAGSYNVKAVIAATNNYAGAEKVVSFTIAKATIGAAFGQTKEITWYNGVTLSAIELTGGFAWADGTTELNVCETKAYDVVYTPEDTKNYNVEYGTFTVTVHKRIITLNGVQDSYAHVYNGIGYEVSGITASERVELVYTYSLGEAPVNAGEYTVTITLKDAAHYTFNTTPDSVVRTIVIAKADVDTVATYNATYGDTLGTLTLPTGDPGVWTWKTGNETLVGDAGTQTHVAVFTSSSDNYNSLERAFTVNVAKMSHDKPTLTEAESVFVYTGDTFTVLGNTELYTVSGNSQSEVGTYTVTITLRDPANHEWTQTSVDPTFTINAGVNAVESIVITGWTYNGETYEPVVETTFGGAVTYQYYNVATPDDIQDGTPTNAGTYVLIVTSTATSNYASATAESAQFTIAQATPTVTFTTAYTVTWNAELTLADVVIDSNECVWKAPTTALEVGNEQTFTAVYTPADTNYHAIDVVITVSVTRASATLTADVAFGGKATEALTHTYNGSALTVSVTASHTEENVVYTVNGEEVDQVSFTNAGEYVVTATLAQTRHYQAAVWERTFTINPAKVTYTLPAWNPQAYDTMATLTPPSVQETLNGGYQWLWMYGDQVVPSTQVVGEPAETVEYVLRFVSNDPNYASFDIDVTLTVGKAMVVPVLEEDVFTYTGNAVVTALTGIPEEVEYSIEYVGDFTSVGEHTIRLTMSEESFKQYSWTGSATNETTLTVTINAGVNAVESIVITGWTYEETENEPVVETTFGGTVTYQYYNVATPDDIQDGTPTNAGTYVLIVTSTATSNYISDTKESAQFTIAQAKPIAPQTPTYEKEWAEDLTLGDITLGSAYQWIDLTDTPLEVGNGQQFTALYTPTNTNYHSITVTLTVNVVKAQALINGVEDSYTSVYNGSAYSLTGIQASHTEAELEIKYFLNGQSVAEIKDVGTYTVQLSLAETRHYKPITVYTTVTITQAPNAWTATPQMSLLVWAYDAATKGEASAEAAFGDVIVEYKPQTADDDAYTQTVPTDAGAYTVRFYVAETSNYAGLTAVTVDYVINKATVTATPDTTAFTYDTTEHTVTVTLDKDVEFSVSGNKATNASATAYTLTVTLLNGNYMFANGTDTYTIDYTIAKASITLGELTTQNGKYAQSAPTASVARTDTNAFDVAIEYYYDVNYDGTFTNKLSTLTELSTATTYYVIAKVEGTDNYDGDTTERVAVKILQGDTSASLVQTQYNINWQEGLTLSALTATGTGEGTYAWIVENSTAEDTSLDAIVYTSFQVKFTPKDTNYAAITVPVTVTVAARKVTVPTTATFTDGTNTVEGNPTYNGGTWTLATTETDDYTISVVGTATSMQNAGDTIKVTFTLKANRAWNGTVNDMTFTMHKAENAITSFTYSADGNHTVTATYYDQDLVSYAYALTGTNDWTATMPQTTGTYDVKVSIAESANYNLMERVFVGAIVISKQTISGQLDKTSAVYTGEEIHVTFSLSHVGVAYTLSCEGATINGNTITVTEAGTYTITATISDTALDLYQWEGTSSASKAFTFTVTQAANGWAEGVDKSTFLSGCTYTSGKFTRTYDATASQVNTANTLVLAGQDSLVITYKQVAKDGTETPLAAGTYPTAAGDYKIYFTVEETNNYKGFSDSISLTINQVATQISTLPTYTANQYQDKFFAGNSAANHWGETAAPAATRVDNSESVAGEFSYGDITIVHTSTNVYGEFTLTFTPGDSNFATSTATVQIVFKNVAHVAKVTAVTTSSIWTGGTLSSQLYYGTIEDALKAAVSGDEVWVLPDTTGNVKIADSDGDKKVTIPTGVTLVLPYAVGTNNYVATFNKDGAGRNPDGKSFTDGDQFTLALESKHLKSKVILVNGVTLEVNGILEVAGHIGGGGSSRFFNGATVGNYAQISMEDNSKIVVNNGGKISLTGFIKGAGGEIIVNNGGILRQPFVCNDHHGGTYMGSVVGQKVAPFNRYQFRNIEYATLRINYGGLMYVYANLYNGSSKDDDGAIGHAEAVFVGKDTGGALNLTTANSYLTSKFTPARGANDNYPYTIIHKDVIEVHIYGGANLDQLTMKLAGTTIESKNFDFPIPACFKVTLHDGSFEMKNMTKLMPGAKLTVEEGATLTAVKLSVYQSVHYVLTGFGDHKFYDEAGAKIPAELWVNGTFNCTTFGGIIYSSNPGATVTISTATTTVKEAYGANLVDIIITSYYDPTYTTYTHTLSLAKSGETGTTYSAAGTYYSDGKGKTGGWYKSGENVTVTFMSNGAVHHTATAAASVNGYTLTASDVAAATREHYTFSHWCFNDGCTNGEGCSNAVTAGMVIYGNAKIYAIWTADEYTLTFTNVLADGSTAATNLANVTFTVETAEIALTTPNTPEEGANFIGWFTVQSGGTALDFVNVAEMAAAAKANGGIATLYAHWTGETTYTIVYDVDASVKGKSVATPTSGSVTESEKANFAPITTVTSGEALTANTNNTAKDIYFDGWYVDAAYTTKWTAWSDDLVNGTTLTLYGRWIDKYEITFNTSTNVGNATTADIATVYLCAGQSYDLSSYATTFTNNNNSNTAITRYFNGWTATGGATVTNNVVTATTDGTVTATWTTKLTVKVGTLSNATISVGNTKLPSGETFYYAPGTITFTISYTESKNKTFTISGGYSYSGSATSYPLDASAGAGKTITVSASSESSGCFVTGTFITLADGTQKRVEDLVAGDMLLTFNHFTGVFEAQPMIFNDHADQAAQWYQIANLQFSDGTVLRIAGYHGIFDMTLNEYAYISVDNMNEYIAHKFYQSKMVNGEIVTSEVTLVKAWMTEEYTRIFAPATAYTMTCVAENMLAASPASKSDKGFHHYFAMGENLTFDEAKLLEDIQAYGLFEYAEFEEYISYEVFEMLQIQYLKIAVGKGYITYETLIQEFEYMKNIGNA